MPPERAIIHVDMDAFFAAIEQRDRPELRAQPVIIGADPQGGRGRGVVSTCSYEAREFGVHSAQPISEAWRRCPHGIYLPVRMEAYVAESRRIRAIFEEFTPQVEPVSIDEAFLDVSGCTHLFGGKRALAERLQARIEEATQLTASLGVAPNKMVAKIASDLEKPRGLVMVEPGEVQAFLRPLPVGRLWGVGPKTQQALARLGVRTIGDLAERDPDDLRERFGKAGAELSDLAHGRDDRPVQPGGEAKSVGHEHTFEHDIADPRRLLATLSDLCEKTAHRLRRAGLRGRTVTTKIRFADFTTLTRATTLPRPIDAARPLYEAAAENLQRVKPQGRRVRLIGVSISRFEPPEERQLSLFEEDVPTDDERDERVQEVVDAIKNRFGHRAVRQARSLEAGKREEPDNEDS
jgi:nucleotidyltransferase/DNA polymerase involved in DNA repair